VGYNLLRWAGFQDCEISTSIWMWFHEKCKKKVKERKINILFWNALPAINVLANTFRSKTDLSNERWIIDWSLTRTGRLYCNSFCPHSKLFLIEFPNITSRWRQSSTVLKPNSLLWNWHIYSKIPDKKNNK